MDELKALWDYQAAENGLEELESSLKNTATRRELVRQQGIVKSKLSHLKQIEQESVLTQNALVEITVQIEAVRRQMEQKEVEIGEIAEYDLEDLFPEDVHEMTKECETIRSSLEQHRRKLADIMHRLEASQNDAKDTLQRISRAKQLFDQLKARHSEELEAGRGDLDRRRQIVRAAERSVPQELLIRYRSIKQHRANPVVHLRNKRCEGCNMEVPSSVLQEIKMGDHIVVCENCGRILMPEEEKQEMN